MKKIGTQGLTLTSGLNLIFNITYRTMHVPYKNLYS